MGIPAEEIGIRETVFSYVLDDGKNIVFAVDRLLAWCKAQKLTIYKIPVDPVFVSYCRENRGIEQHRLDQLTIKQCREPLLFCTWYDESQLLVDGHHRYVNLGNRGSKWCRGWVLKPAQWEPFLVDGFGSLTSSELMSMSSGLF